MSINPVGHHPLRHPPDPSRPDQGADQEDRAMTLPELVDLAATAAGTDVPCQVENPEIWFADTPEGVEFAKALCATCPVQAACLTGALQRREPWGVWGGELFVSGRTVARKRPRGRPRRDEVAA